MPAEAADRRQGLSRRKPDMPAGAAPPAGGQPVHPEGLRFSFGSNFRQGRPDDEKTTTLGIWCVLNS